MQKIWMNIDGRIQELCIPADTDEVMPGAFVQLWRQGRASGHPSIWRCRPKPRRVGTCVPIPQSNYGNRENPKRTCANGTCEMRGRQ